MKRRICKETKRNETSSAVSYHFKLEQNASYTDIEVQLRKDDYFLLPKPQYASFMELHIAGNIVEY